MPSHSTRCAWRRHIAERVAIPLALAFAFALVASAASVAAQPRPVPITKPIQYYNPDWSPDGHRLVFESTLPGPFSIYTINADGSALNRLTIDTSNNEQPSWSPDGKRIVFSSDRAGHSDIYVMNADGSAQTRVSVTAGGGYYGSSFSADGKWIVFQGRPDNSEARDRVYVVAVDGSGLRQVTDSTYGAESPHWSASGTSITFTQVQYPKRLWSEMTPADVAAAKRTERPMVIARDGSGLAPAPAVTPSLPAAVVADAKASPDKHRFAFTKSVSGYQGVYVYDVASQKEQLVAGGPGAGPVGYLRTATLTASTDTLDTYDSARGGTIVRGNGSWVVHTIRPMGGARWDVTDTWHDSTGRVTARQSSFTSRGSLATERENTRADGDSASLVITGDRVVAWIAQKKGMRLYDGPMVEERFSPTVMAAAIAKSSPAIGALFVAPVAQLYSANPVETLLDSVRVIRRDTLFQGAVPIPVLVLERSAGGQEWVNEKTGVEVLSRGNAGPERWWWHIRRGVKPPDGK